MSNELKRIAGAGGGKGGGAGRVAVEAPDSLRSSQHAMVVEAISEGEIEGLVDGLKSVYLNDTPIMNQSGGYNFEGASLLFTNGSQSQSTFSGNLPVAVGTGAPVVSTTQVNVEVKNGVPVTRSLTNSELDWVKVVVGVPQLSSQDMSNGDVSGTSVEYLVQVQNGPGAGFETKVTGNISGKTSSYYRREHKIYLSGNGPWDVRVVRLTEDSTKTALQNKTFWTEMVEGIDVKLSYPNTAMAYLRMDASQFQSIPRRGYDIKGIRVQVPTNYDPITRTYSGLWDGSFKIAWTDNPAWCFYDLLTNDRYGLGEYIDAGQVDKWGLYQVAKYCDEKIPDGFGGTEPRFTCNLYLQTQEDAFKVINSMASIFRGMTYYADSQILVSQDSPKDSVALFTAANVIDGTFNYQGADRRARHTVALVSWNDPQDMFRQKIEYVADDDGIQRWGVVQTEVLAVGCTSRGQAHRAGKWLLYTEQHESETVSFRAGMDAARIAPGDVISIQDSVKSGQRMGGRIAAATLNSVTFDADVAIGAGVAYELSVILPDGSLETRQAVLPGNLTVRQLQLQTALSKVPLVGAMWVLSSESLTTEKWRVISIAEVEPTVVEITALYYNPGKFSAIESDMVLEAIPTSLIKTRPGRVTELDARTELYRVNESLFSTRIAVSWTAPEGATSYNVIWRRENENEKLLETRSSSIDLDNVSAGNYTIKVMARNSLGIAGDWVTIPHTVSPSGIAPDVQNLRANPNFSGRDLPVTWDAVESATEYELQVLSSDGQVLIRTERLGVPTYTYTYAKNVSDGGLGGPRRSLMIKVRAKTLLGYSANWASSTFSNAAPAAPVSILAEPGPGQVSVLAVRPQEDDIAGMMLWMSTDPAVPMSDTTKVYEGTDNAFTKVGLQPGTPVYFKAAFYDHFGKVNLNASTGVSAIPTSTGGVLKVTSLPDAPTSVNGELAVFLDVADEATRGLYGWSGTEWVSTRKLLDGSITTDKLAPNAVDYTKLALGAVQARNLSVKKHFLY